jgi:hypothetical protein
LQRLTPWGKRRICVLESAYISELLWRRFHTQDIYIETSWQLSGTEQIKRMYSLPQIQNVISYSLTNLLDDSIDSELVYIVGGYQLEPYLLVIIQITGPLELRSYTCMHAIVRYEALGGCLPEECAMRDLRDR